MHKLIIGDDAYYLTDEDLENFHNSPYESIELWFEKEESKKRIP